MTSHVYTVTPRDLGRLVLPPLLTAMAVVALLRVLGWLDLLPSARPVLDPDQTVLAYQAQASGLTQAAEIALTGDSSCLMDVDAPELSRYLPAHPPVINLGLIIGLGLEADSEVLGDFLRHNPHQVRLALLLVTPELLRDADYVPFFARRWRVLHAHPQVDDRPPAGSGWGFTRAIDLFRQRLLSRVLALPLQGTDADFYGFSSVLRDYLRAHHGSLTTRAAYHRPRPGPKIVYSLAPTFEPASRRFRQGLPRGLTLAVGLTPVPESLVAPDYPRQRDALLRQWNGWLHADLVLTNLPATLPEGLFASGAHLNRQGQARFTRLLARQLASAWAAATPRGGPSLPEPEKRF